MGLTSRWSTYTWRHGWDASMSFKPRLGPLHRGGQKEENMLVSMYRYCLPILPDCPRSRSRIILATKVGSRIFSQPTTRPAPGEGPRKTTTADSKKSNIHPRAHRGMIEVVWDGIGFPLPWSGWNACVFRRSWTNPSPASGGRLVLTSFTSPRLRFPTTRPR